MVSTHLPSWSKPVQLHAAACPDGAIAGWELYSLQVPNQSIFCNSVVGGNPFTCSGVRLPDRNAFYGPGYWNIDWNFYKNFKLTERFTMQFRGEFYNIFNHHNQYISTLQSGRFVDSGTGSWQPLHSE